MMMTMEELKAFAASAADRVAHLGEFLKIEDKRVEMAALEGKMSAPDFWDHKEEAQATVAALSSCRNVIEPYEKVKKEVGELGELKKLFKELVQRA